MSVNGIASRTYHERCMLRVSSPVEISACRTERAANPFYGIAKLKQGNRECDVPHVATSDLATENQVRKPLLHSRRIAGQSARTNLAGWYFLEFIGKY